VPQRIVTANLQEAWAALAIIRETVETLGPVGSMKASEHLDGPTFMHEADEIVSAIRALIGQPRNADPVSEWVQCSECWQPATCKKYGCRVLSTDRVKP
jgi:hypothetical protein